MYPYDKSAVTADLGSFEILLKCMISENANRTTIDLTDFYLGTPLPHSEYIRIPISMIPERVSKFYNLTEYISSNAIYFLVHQADSPWTPTSRRLKSTTTLQTSGS